MNNLVGNISKDILMNLLKTNLNVLISGQVGDGKTWLLEQLLKNIDTEEKLLILENSPKLKNQLVGNHKYTQLIGSPDCQLLNTNIDDLLAKNTLDITQLNNFERRIVLDEIGVLESKIEAPRMVTTICSTTPEKALIKYAFLKLYSRDEINLLGNPIGINKVIASYDICIQITSKDSFRVVHLENFINNKLSYKVLFDIKGLGLMNEAIANAYYPLPEDIETKFITAGLEKEVEAYQELFD